MSRTYRTYLDGEYIANGEIIHWRNIDRDSFPYGMGIHYRYRLIKNRDHKPWGKPPKWFKQIKRRIERAKVNHALRTDKDIPIFKRSDRWDWT